VKKKKNPILLKKRKTKYSSESPPKAKNGLHCHKGMIDSKEDWKVFLAKLSGSGGGGTQERGGHGKVPGGAIKDACHPEGA